MPLHSLPGVKTNQVTKGKQKKKQIVEITNKMQDEKDLNDKGNRDRGYALSCPLIISVSTL